MAQFARPSSDVTTTNWTRSTGTNAYYTYIDETAADTADYVQTQTVNSGLEIGLSSVTDPASSSGHIVRVQAWSLGSAAAEAHTILLLQGSTTIATVVSANLSRTVGTQINYTLTAAQADSITNYADLRLRFTPTTLAAGETYRVGWAELEIPDVVTVTRRIFII